LQEKDTIFSSPQPQRHSLISQQPQTPSKCNIIVSRLKTMVMVVASSMPPTPNHPRGRCVSLEENVDDVGALLHRAAQAQASHQQQHDDNNGSVLGRGGVEYNSYLSSIYRPRRTICGANESTSADGAAAAATADHVMSTMKRQSSHHDDDVDGKAPPKKISRKKHHRRISTEVVYSCLNNNHGDGGNHPTDVTINPTHLMFTPSPKKAPKKAARTKRRVLCSAIGCSNTSFHNGVMCFHHGGNHTIHPINLFSAHQAAE
jgi:hypothetical protein